MNFVKMRADLRAGRTIEFLTYRWGLTESGVYYRLNHLDRMPVGWIADALRDIGRRLSDYENP